MPRVSSCRPDPSLCIIQMPVLPSGSVISSFPMNTMRPFFPICAITGSMLGGRFPIWRALLPSASMIQICCEPLRIDEKMILPSGVQEGAPPSVAITVLPLPSACVL